MHIKKNRKYFHKLIGKNGRL